MLVVNLLQHLNDSLFSSSLIDSFSFFLFLFPYTGLVVAMASTFLFLSHTTLSLNTAPPNLCILCLLPMNPFNDIINTARISKHHINLSVEQEYATYQSITKKALRNDEEAQRLRDQGRKNIDLWVDGRLYPVDLAFNAHSHRIQADMLMGVANQAIQGLQERIETLNHEKTTALQQMASLESKLYSCREETIRLKEERDFFERRVSFLKCQSEKLKRTPLGPRERVRGLRALDSLAQNGGGWKRRIRATKKCIKEVAKLNMENKSDRIKFIEATMNRSDFIEFLKQPQKKDFRDSLAREITTDYHNLVSPAQVVEACDTVGVSRRGYRTLSKVFFQSLKCKRLRVFGLPRPSLVCKAKMQENKNIPKLIGDYKFICGEMPVEKKTRPFVLNEYNNVFVDVKRV